MELKLEGLTKKYGQTLALSDFSATLTPGVYALLGPNGAGKSTLMNLICNILKPDAGKILWNQTETAVLGGRFRAVLGYMPQQQRLYERFTGRQFLHYMAALKGLDRKTAKAETERVLALVNLTDDAHRRLSAYSGGMRQRILIAQAVLGAPQLLILDEPTAGLDPKERIRIRTLISRISSGIIVILATHVVSDVESIAKEVLLLKKGRIAAQDSPAALCDTIDGQVFEIECDETQADVLAASLCVVNLNHRGDRVLLRVLCEEPLEGVGSKAVPPGLEDVYLHYFGEEAAHGTSH